MRKIASTTELQSELRRILAYAQSVQPSRRKLASQLQTLSDRVAILGPLTRPTPGFLPMHAEKLEQIVQDTIGGHSYMNIKVDHYDQGEGSEDSTLVLIKLPGGSFVVDGHDGATAMAQVQHMPKYPEMDAKERLAAAKRFLKRFAV